MQLFVAMKQLDLKTARDAFRTTNGRRLTMEQLAALSGVVKSTISRIEAGLITNPSNDTVKALEQALKLRPGTLVFGQVREEEVA